VAERSRCLLRLVEITDTRGALNIEQGPWSRRRR
jgi:hypothetical protein